MLALAAVFVLAGGPRAALARQSGEPLRLEAAIAEALRRSPALAPALEAVDASDIRRDLAESAFDVKVLPSLQMGRDSLGFDRRGVGVDVVKRFQTGGEVRLSADAERLVGTDLASSDTGYAVSISQPVLHAFGPTATAGLKDARRAAVGSTRALDLARQDLVLTVSRAFFDVVRLRRLVEAGELARERAAKLRAASDARMQVGLATRLDVLRADLLVSQADSTLADHREALARAEDELNILLGRPLESPLLVDASAAPGIETLPPDAFSLDDLVTMARASRLDVREARERVDDARRQESVAKWNLVPRLDLTVSYARRGVGSPIGGLLDQMAGGWRAGFTTSFSLDRASEAAAVGLAQVSVRGARRALDDRERRVASEVRSAWRARRRAGASVEIQTKAVALAEQQLRLAELRYERGLAGNFDVIDAESNLFQAQSALVAAQVDLAYAGLALERAVGVLDPGRFGP